MALSFPIVANQTDAKSPVADQLMDAIRQNLEALDLKTWSGGGVFEFKVSGELSVLNGRLPFRRIDGAFVSSARTLTSYAVYLEIGGQSGTLEVDIRKYKTPRTPIIGIDDQYSASINSITMFDKTVVLSGFGKVASDGYLFIRVREGAAPTGEITLYVPPLECKRENCVKFQTWRLDGSLGIAGGIKQGETHTSFSLAELTSETDRVNLRSDGEYKLKLKVYFLDQDGEERSSLAEGFIRVNVMSADYEPLACNDPMSAWNLVLSNNCSAQYSSSLRSALCGKGCGGR